MKINLLPWLVFMKGITTLKMTQIKGNNYYGQDFIQLFSSMNK